MGMTPKKHKHPGPLLQARQNRRQSAKDDAARFRFCRKAANAFASRTNRYDLVEDFTQAMQESCLAAEAHYDQTVASFETFVWKNFARHRLSDVLRDSVGRGVPASTLTRAIEKRDKGHRLSFAHQSALQASTPAEIDSGAVLAGYAPGEWSAVEPDFVEAFCNALGRDEEVRLIAAEMDKLSQVERASLMPLYQPDVKDAAVAAMFGLARESVVRMRARVLERLNNAIS